MNIQTEKLYEQTLKTPLKTGVQYLSYQVGRVGNIRLEFKQSKQIKWAALFMIVYGIIQFSLDYFKNLQTFGESLPGLFLLFLGTFILWRLSKPMIFDKRRGLFWVNKPRPEQSLEDLKTPTIPLTRIKAVQVIHEKELRKNNMKTASELNLVLDNGERFHLLRSDNGIIVNRQSELIVEFLQIPLWIEEA